MLGKNYKMWLIQNILQNIRFLIFHKIKSFTHQKVLQLLINITLKSAILQFYNTGIVRPIQFLNSIARFYQSWISEIYKK